MPDESFALDPDEAGICDALTRFDPLLTVPPHGLPTGLLDLGLNLSSLGAEGFDELGDELGERAGFEEDAEGGSLWSHFSINFVLERVDALPDLPAAGLCFFIIKLHSSQ